MSLPAGTQEHLRAHQEAAPVKLSAIARGFGLSVTSSTLPAGISGEIRPDASGGFEIKVNRHDSVPRQRFTVAHEIAHFLLHRDEIGKGIRDDALYRSSLSDFREAQANRLAADILMPTQLLEEEKHKVAHLAGDALVSALSEKFGVSEAAMRIRLGIV